MGGSKLEITRLLIEQGLGIPIPRSTWKYHGQSLDTVLRDFNSFRKPVIVRGSHPNDYHGFIDVIPTIRDVSTISELEKAIDKIESTVASEDVRVHAEDWGQPYTPTVHILIQEQSPSFAVGSMLRHPHNGNIEIIYFDLSEDGRYYPSYAWVNKKGLTHLSSSGISDAEIEELIELYKKIENSGIVDNEWAQQVEFGLKPLNFFQARPFKKLRTAEEFAIPEPADKTKPYLTTNCCFGITDSKGIEMRFQIASTGDAKFWDSMVAKEGEYGLILTDKTRRSFPVGKRFGNIRAYCSISSLDHLLLHPDYRLMKKAEYGLAGYLGHNVKSLFGMSYDKADLKTFQEARLFSNGNSAVVIPSQFL